MGFWNEYNPEFGIVFDEIDDAINAALNGTAGGGGAPPPKPNAPERSPPPAGATPVPGNPNRAITNTVAYTYNTTTGNWDAGLYPPSKDERTAILGPSGGTTGGTTKPGGTTFTPFPTSTERRAQEQATKGFTSALPPGAYQVADTRAVDRTGLTVWTKDTTGNWTNAGYPPTKEDKQAAMRVAMEQRNGGGSSTTTGATPNLGLPTGQAVATQPGNESARMQTPGGPTTLTPEARPFAGLGGLGLGGTLEPRNGPVVPGMDAFRQPGIGIPTEGRQNINGVSTGLNTLMTGRQGSAQQIPITPGFRREGENGNSISFASGASGNGMAEPQMLFGPTSVSVPGTYTYGQGNVGDSNRAYSVPFNIGPGGAGLMNLAGNNVQINSADKGTGYGFALNAMPSSNVGAATARNLSEDPASQAAQTLMLNAAINQMGGGPGAIQALTATNPNQYGGFHAGTGNGPFSGNGGTGQGTWFAGYDPNRDQAGFGGDYSPFERFAGGGMIRAVPLGGPVSTPKSMVTNGPKYLIDAKTGKVEALMGEDNADPGTAPNRERLTFSGPHNSMLHITPLQPFAGGGFIQTQQQPFYPQQQGPQRPDSYENRLYDLWVRQHASVPTGPWGTSGLGPIVPFATGGTVTTDATTPTSDTTTPTPDPLDPSIAAPWIQEQQANAQRQAVRDRYLYRNRAAGIEGPTAIDVLQGDAPQQELAPNMYFSTDKQVNNSLNSILGAQADIRALGDPINTDPIYGEIGTIGTQLDAQQRLRDMATTKAGLEAQNEAEKAQALSEYEALQYQLIATRNAYNNARYLASQTAGELPPEDAQRLLDMEAKIYALDADSKRLLARSQGDSPALTALRAQEQALQGTLGDNWSEAAARTRLAQLQTQIGNNDQRIKKGEEVANLAKLGVPRLNGPILPVSAAA